MGGGGTIADGLRRLFQRRSTTSTKHRRNDNDDADHDNRVSVKDLRSQLATIPTTNDDRHHHTPKSSLFNIKVPVQPLFPPSSMDPNKKGVPETEFFTEYGEASQYQVQEIIGKGSYGVVCSAIDIHTGEKVAIKKIHDVFEHVSDATRILREIKLLRLLRHPDIVEIRHIMLPPSRREFKDVYVVPIFLNLMPLT